MKRLRPGGSTSPRPSTTLGSLTGMFVAKEFILAKLNAASEEERAGAAGK